MTEREIELKLRNEPFCRGCGSRKGVGLLVCWGCFKYRDNPLKYFRIDTPDAGDVVKWLKDVGGDTTGLE